MFACWFLWGLSCPISVQAGGSGLNVLVVANQASSNSCLLANYFCEQRGLPAEHLVRITWPNGNTAWTATDFTNHLLVPLLDALVTRGLTNQIDYVVLSMDIPFRTTTIGGTENSTTAALFYGLREAALAGEGGVTNSYAGSEAEFRPAQPRHDTQPAFLTTMLTAHTLEEAKTLVDQGVASDGTQPAAPVLLVKSSDPVRNIRYSRFDDVILNARLAGSAEFSRINSDSTAGLSGLLGYATGLANFTLPPGMFNPGAIGDSLTSFGGIIFGPNSQTSLLAFVAAGATGSYGTVAEPSADIRKFPDPMVYFYQRRGFSLAECYYQSLRAPYLGLIVAEPLAAPFALPGSGSWSFPPANAELSGTIELALNFVSHDSQRPLQQIDLFVDGKYFRTLTHAVPRANDQLYLGLNGYSLNYAVPTNATLTSIASNLAALINSGEVTGATHVQAGAHGDRIELQSTATNHQSFPFYVTSPFGLSTTQMFFRVAYLSESHPPTLKLQPSGSGGALQLRIAAPTALHYVVQASTNLRHWVPVFTNATSGSVVFQDPDHTNFPHRFYRVRGPVPNQPPALWIADPLAGAGLPLRLESQPGQPSALFASTNGIDWTALATNPSGGTLDFLDAAYRNYAHRFYRGQLVNPPLPDLSVVPVGVTTLARIDHARQPYRVEFSTNGTIWNGIVTNFHYQEMQTTAGSVALAGQTPTTFLRASRATFLTGNAFGVLPCTFLAGTLTPGAWVQFTFTKTNGAMVDVAVTNHTGTPGATNLAYKLYSAINAHEALQGGDGVVAEDFHVNAGNQSLFNLRARRPGYEAARITVVSKGSGYATGVAVSPAASCPLLANAADLQPRNHLYVSTGALQLGGVFPLDTTDLSDGYHELTAVAYEGTSVRTQTRATVPVRIRNTALSATLTLLDLTNQAPASACYHVQVTANDPSVRRTTLYSTGGVIGMASNNAAPVFEVAGTNLWAGRHPFYAVVETATGRTFRTRTEWIRLR